MLSAVELHSATTGTKRGFSFTLIGVQLRVRLNNGATALASQPSWSCWCGYLAFGDAIQLLFSGDQQNAGQTGVILEGIREREEVTGDLD